MGLIVTMGPIAFRQVLPGLALKSAARELAAVFREARGTAIRDGTQAYVLIDVDAHTYRLGDAGAQRELESGLGLELLTSSSEQLNDSEGRVRFYPDGTSTGGRLTLTKNDRKLHVVVDWLTGRVELRD